MNDGGSYAWDWRDGCMVYSRRSIVLYNYRATCKTRLEREVEAEFAGLTGTGHLWPRVENAAWAYLRRLREEERIDSRAKRIARPCKRCGAVFTPLYRIVRPYCSQRCYDNVYYHRRYRTDPVYRARLQRESRERYGRVKADPKKYEKQLAYHREYARRVGLRQRQHAATMADPEKRAKKNADLRAWREKKRGGPSTRRPELASSYGKWTVLGEAGMRGKSRYALCQCSCGRQGEVRVQSLLSHESVQCRECAQRQLADDRRSAALKRRPFAPAELFSCERLHTTLSRGSCAARFRACNAPSASEKRQQKLMGRSLACSRCETGAAHGRAETAAVQVVKLRARRDALHLVGAMPRCLGCGEPVPSRQHRVCSDACAETLAMEKRWSAERQLPEWVNPARFSAVQVDV